MGGRGALKPLVRCPLCAGGLIYPTYWSIHDGVALLERHCPECEHRDCVRTSRLAAELWLGRLARHAEDLSVLADALSNGLDPGLAPQRASP